MSRGFKVAKGYSHKDVEIPTRSTDGSAGYDFKVLETVYVNPGQVVLIPTGIKAFMEDDEVLKIYARSSLPKKKHLMLPNSVGIIDSDYYENEDNDGVIFMQVYNFGTAGVKLAKGERIAQGIFMKFLTATAEEEVTAKRGGGFGSTG